MRSAEVVPAATLSAQVTGELASRLDDHTARGLANAVARSIGDGVLASGQRLPPVREIATRLELSPTTVSAAWQLLARSGTIRTAGRRGTVVASPAAGGPRRYRQALAGSTRFAQDLSTGVADQALLPDLGTALARMDVAAPRSYLDPPVLAELERVLRDQLPYQVDNLTIVDGAMDAMDQVASSLLRMGGGAVVEDPCFPPLLDLLDALGVAVTGVPLDAEGPQPQAFAAALAGRPRVVFLQPRAHNPTGASWSVRRTKELAEALARAPATVVVEDDSAGDIATSPPASIGCHLPGQTVHIRSFAKSHGPDLRLAVVAGPEHLMAPVVERRLLGQGWSSRLLQALLLELLTDAGSVAQVAHARREYARRRHRTVTALRHLGLPLDEGDGLNLWLGVRDEQAALISLASEGIAAAAGTPFQVRPTGAAHVRVTVGLVARDHAGLARRLARAALAGPTAPVR